MSNAREANAREIPLLILNTAGIVARCLHCETVVRIEGEAQTEYRELVHRRSGRHSAMCEACHKDFDTRARYIGNGGAWNEGKKLLPAQ
jgi:hypothetical protein